MDSKEKETIEMVKSLTDGQLLDISTEVVEFGLWLGKALVAMAQVVCEVYREEGEPYGNSPEGLVRWIEERRALREITQKLRSDPGALALLAAELKGD